jgi:regulator of nucleoside diphosphate kinase
MERKIFITEKDKLKLKRLCEQTIGYRVKDLKTVKDLIEELERAEVLQVDDFPKDVITMNTKVKIRDLRTGNAYIYTIVYPEEADFENNRISILAPIGTALLGYREGDTIEWDVPAGKRRLKVERILHQPEAFNKVML